VVAQAPAADGQLDPGPIVAMAGRTVVVPDVYEVAAEKIREFAVAIGETAAVCHDVAAAQAAGHRGVVAPPTFAIVPVFRGLDLLTGGAFSRDDAAIPAAHLIHGEQRLTHRRPLVAGDRVRVAATVLDARHVGTTVVLTIRTDLLDDPVAGTLGAGQHDTAADADTSVVCQARTVVMVTGVREPAAADGDAG
jgi:acyl dehydratase